MMQKYRIIVVPLVGGVPPNQVFDYQALRVSPNVYTTVEEIDTFVEAMEDALENDVPPAGPSAGGAPEAGTEWI
jgi:selenocysteine lyase/cysteine desulfurase